MPAFRLSFPAELDLKSIEDYIAKDNPEAARRVVLAIGKKCEFLAEHATLFPPLPRLKNLCKSRVDSYLIFYRPGPDDIEVVRILHGARDIENILMKMH